jgi:hypothetical protein
VVLWLILFLFWSATADAGTTNLCATVTTGQPNGACNLGQLTFTQYTTTGATLQLPNTTNLVEEINQGVKSAITITLNPTGLFAGYAQCVADNGQNFYTWNMTVVTSDSTTIGGQSGATGLIMNNKGESLCFVYDGVSNWIPR